MNENSKTIVEIPEHLAPAVRRLRDSFCGDKEVQESHVGELIRNFSERAAGPGQLAHDAERFVDDLLRKECPEQGIDD